MAFDSTNTGSFENVNATLKSRDIETDHVSLNAQLEQFRFDIETGEKKIQYEKDREAVRQYFLNVINPNSVFFHSLEEKIEFLIKNEYYEKEPLDKYDFEFVKDLFKKVYSHKFRFHTFVGAYKFYSSYAQKTFDGKRWLERFEDRVALTALYLADGNRQFAEDLAEEMITGRFQPATPTFLNAGKKQRGDLVSCFLLNISDDLNSIMRAVNSAAQLSKRGGGVALNLTNIRAKGDPIKKVENQSSGVIPVMKILEDTFSYANQLGARQGAGAVYLNAHHLDIMEFLDTKRENADEKIRIKTLSLGVVIPDITFELARSGKPMYLFSPYDLEQEFGKEMAWLNITDIYDEAVANPRIRKKKINPRDFLTTLTEIQMESGYPYILFEDAANRDNNVGGKITMSNLCVEIIQPQVPGILNDDQTYAVMGEDISCNLGSLNIQKALESPNFGKTVNVAVRALSQVSRFSDIEAVPTVREGNRKNHSIGLGQMNLHGSFVKNHIFYGDEESLDFTNIYFQAVLFEALKASNQIAKETGEVFNGFEDSKYADGSFFDRFINPTRATTPQTAKVKKIVEKSTLVVPTSEDWVALAKSVKKHGLYNSHLLAIPPTGSISYVNHSTPSTIPVTFNYVEKRSEGKLGTVYVENPYAEGNEKYYSGTNMYDIDSRKVIDVNSVIQYYTDQSISLTLGYRSSATTRDVMKNILYAFAKGKPSDKAPTAAEDIAREKVLSKFPAAEIKTLYYVRVYNESLVEDDTCVSCAL